jgi:hypothetical protein
MRPRTRCGQRVCDWSESPGHKPGCDGVVMPRFRLAWPCLIPPRGSTSHGNERHSRAATRVPEHPLGSAPETTKTVWVNVDPVNDGQERI